MSSGRLGVLSSVWAERYGGASNEQGGRLDVLSRRRGGASKEKGRRSGVVLNELEEKSGGVVEESGAILKDSGEV